MNINYVHVALQMRRMIGSTRVTAGGAWEVEAVYSNSMGTTHTL